MTTSCTMGAGHFFVESIPRSLRLYVPLNVAMTLFFRWRQLFSDPMGVLLKIAQGSARSSLFLSSYCTTAWLVPCLLRNTFGYDANWMYVGENGGG